MYGGGVFLRIYTVQRGDTFFSVSRKLGVSQDLLAEWNGLSPPYRLAVGQALIALTPRETYSVQSGDTLSAIARKTGVSPRGILANNPALAGGLNEIFPGQTLVLSFSDERTYEISTNGSAYPFIGDAALYGNSPYFSFVSPFTYGFTPDGELIPPDAQRIVAVSSSLGAAALLHLSTLTENGTFSSALAAALLKDPSARRALVSNILGAVRQNGYAGLDVDFEYIDAADAALYASFIAEAREELNRYGYIVIAALAPKSYAAQPGQLYEGHDYRLIGAAANFVSLMTYEWGYTYGPPMAVAPIDSVRRVVDYAVTEIAPEKIYMGIPNYAYDWTLPYVSGARGALSIGNDEAVRLAVEVGAEIFFDERSQTPFFNYYTEGDLHEVWFEDARSIDAKFSLLREYGLYGAGIWNMMRPFTQGFLYIQATNVIRAK